MLDCCRAQSKSCHVGLVRLKIQVPDQAQVQEANKKKASPKHPSTSAVVNGIVRQHPRFLSHSPLQQLHSRYSAELKQGIMMSSKWPLSAQSHRCVPLLASPKECGTASASILVRQNGSLCIVAGTTYATTLQRRFTSSRNPPPPPLDTTASFSHIHSPIRCPPPGTAIHGSDPLDHLPWFLSRHHVLVATALHLEVAQAGFVRLAKVVVLVVAG